MLNSLESCSMAKLLRASFLLAMGFASERLHHKPLFIVILPNSKDDRIYSPWNSRFEWRLHGTGGPVIGREIPGKARVRLLR